MGRRQDFREKKKRLGTTALIDRISRGTGSISSVWSIDQKTLSRRKKARLRSKLHNLLRRGHSVLIEIKNSDRVRFRP